MIGLHSVFVPNVDQTKQMVAWGARFYGFYLNGSTEDIEGLKIGGIKLFLPIFSGLRSGATYEAGQEHGSLAMDLMKKFSLRGPVVLDAGNSEEYLDGFLEVVDQCYLYGDPKVLSDKVGKWSASIWSTYSESTLPYIQLSFPGVNFWHFADGTLFGVKVGFDWAGDYEIFAQHSS